MTYLFPVSSLWTNCLNLPPTSHRPNTHTHFDSLFFQQVFEAALAARPKLSLLPQGTELRPAAAEKEILQKGSVLRETWAHSRVSSRQTKNLSGFPGEFFQEGLHR